MRIIHFNVLPYREQRNKKKQLYIMFELLVVLLLVLVFCFAVSMNLSDRLQKQVDYLGQLQNLENELAGRVQHVESVKKEVEDLQRKVSALESVEKESLDNSRLFAFIDQSLPSVIALSKITSNGFIVSVEGLTSSVADLASWVEVLEGAKPIFSQAELMSVLELDENKRKTLPGYYAFTLKLRIKPMEAANAQTQ